MTRCMLFVDPNSVSGLQIACHHQVLERARVSTFSVVAGVGVFLG